MNLRIEKYFLAFSLSLAVAPFLAQGQTTTPVTPAPCSNASLSGTHGLVLTGRSVSSSIALSNIELAVGTATFDGAGNVTINLTTNTASTQAVSQTLSGTYSLPSNCLGTLSITSGDTASFTLIPYNSGNGFSLTGQDSTYAITATGTAQPTACVTATLSGEYTFTGNGYSLSSGAITGVNTITGLLQFDGAGNVTGNWSISANGATTASSVTGKYTVAAPACVASATVTDANGLSYAISFTETSANQANFSATIASSANTVTVNGHSAFTYPGLAVELAAGANLTVPAGSLFSIYGIGLSTGEAGFTKFPLPKTLGSATVTITQGSLTETVPIYAVDNTALGTTGLINAQMPLDVQPGVATLSVQNGTGVSNSVAITIPASAQPAVFAYPSANAANHTLAQNYPSFTLNSESAQAPLNSTVVVYLTGAGPVSGQNLLTTGTATPGSQFFDVSESYSATIAGVNAPVQSITLVPTLVGGFYQANITVPSGVGAGDRALVITIGGKTSNVTLLSVQ